METIEQILKKAELQHKIISLQAMFSKNMAFFETAMPNIFQQFKDYTPTEIKITITPDGWLDLENTNLNGMLVYGQDAEEFAKKTVDSYIQSPLTQRLNPVETITLNPDESHAKNLNAITRLLANKDIDFSRKPLEPKTQFMFMLGIGLGYQVTELLKHTEIQHLCIAETNLDIFYASMYTFDWEVLAKKFDENTKTINIVLGQTPEMFNNMVTVYVKHIGIFNVARPHIFSHLSSKELNKATEAFLQNIPSMASSLGYFDDEKIGLTHTINNFKNRIPFLRNHGFLTKQYENKPVFLIGNGPSLDLAKDFILKNQDKAIIISCGTAMSSLFKMGIKPDFHVELERTYPIKEWIETTTPAAYRKGIRLLALNTVHPDLPKLFETTGMALKYNDLGATFISDYISDSELSVTLGACNPTVANAGLSFCAALGFVEIYMFGIDLGFPDGNKHHSEHSFHYDINQEHIESFALDSPENPDNVTLKGNFGGTVTSTLLFLRSKTALEAILKDCKDIKCYNTSNGVEIEKTIPMKISEINIHQWKSIDKKKYCNTLFRKYFTNKNLIIPPKDALIEKQFLPAIDVLQKTFDIFNSDIKSIDEGFILLDKSIDQIRIFSNNPETNKLTNLLKGSADAFSLLLGICLTATDTNVGISLFNQAKEFYKNYLVSAQNTIENKLLENDYFGYDIKNKLKANP